MSKQQKILACALTLLTLTIALISSSSRFIPIKCALCQDEIQNVSYIEYKMGPWDNIPCLHTTCYSYINSYLAPNCDMTTAQWLETRGWSPRPNQTTGKTNAELSDFINNN
jgi:hypothetical protein